MICVERMLISEMTPEIYELFYAWISPERQARAERYRRREDRLRCVAGEVLLRYVLKKTRNLTEMTVECNEFGKPGIKGMGDFYYNLSHSGEWVVIAYGDSEVGIDIEQICMNAGKEKIARQYFTEHECDYIFEAGEERAVERFFEIWTAKESYVKYLGTGLRMPLNSFDVLSMETPLFYKWVLDDEYCIALCSMDREYMFRRAEVKDILEMCFNRA